MSEPLTVREYAMKEGVTLGTAYRRIWEGQVVARQMYGRWLISPGNGAEQDGAATHAQPERQCKA
jgi:hypothetical protein